MARALFQRESAQAPPQEACSHMAARMILAWTWADFDIGSYVIGVVVCAFILLVIGWNR